MNEFLGLLWNIGIITAVTYSLYLIFSVITEGILILLSYTPPKKEEDITINEDDIL